VLAYFDGPGTSNGPTEAINGRLEHLRGSALGFRNLTNYIARSLLESGPFRPQDYTPDCEEPLKLQLIAHRSTLAERCGSAGLGTTELQAENARLAACEDVPSGYVSPPSGHSNSETLWHSVAARLNVKNFHA